VYDGGEYVKCLRAGSGFHDPDAVDYQRILADFDIVDKINRGAIDEVWLYAFPYGGFYESIMAGPGAFWCNAPELRGTERAQRRFVIMGFSYERGVGEMLEDMGHRAESIMEYVFRHQPGEANLWKRFTRFDKSHPGQAEVGTIHYAPNSRTDYDWGNKTKTEPLPHVEEFPQSGRRTPERGRRPLGLAIRAAITCGGSASSRTSPARPTASPTTGGSTSLTPTPCADSTRLFAQKPV
jgi:hypothetical protein